MRRGHKHLVMAGLDPAILFPDGRPRAEKDARLKAGHDDLWERHA